MEDSNEMVQSPWLSWAMVAVGPSAERRVDTAPSGGCRCRPCSGWLWGWWLSSFFPTTPGWIPTAGRAVLHEVQLGGDGSPQHRAVRLHLLSWWDWPSHSLSQRWKTINILGMSWAVPAGLTRPHVRPHCSLSLRARRGAESFQGCVKGLFCLFPVNSKSFYCLPFRKCYSSCEY